MTWPSVFKTFKLSNAEKRIETEEHLINLIVFVYSGAIGYCSKYGLVLRIFMPNILRKRIAENFPIFIQT